MATKAQIDTIFANITTGGANTAVEALACWNALKGELYATPQIQNPSNTQIVTRINSNLVYVLYFTKRGNRTDVHGAISLSQTNPIAPNSTLFSFVSGTEYRPRTGVFEQYLTAEPVGTGQSFSLIVDSAGNGTIKTTEPIYTTGSNLTYIVKGFYLNND